MANKFGQIWGKIQTGGMVGEREGGFKTGGGEWGKSADFELDFNKVVTGQTGQRQQKEEGEEEEEEEEEEEKEDEEEEEEGKEGTKGNLHTNLVENHGIKLTQTHTHMYTHSHSCNIQI